MADLSYNPAMHPFRTFACAFLFFAFSWNSQAQNIRWFEVASGNFILYTDTSEAKGRRLVTDLEQRVAAFQAAFGAVPKRQFPIQILLFKTSEDFLSSAPTVVPPEVPMDSYNAAYLLKGQDRTFIVAQDRSPDDIANEVGHALGHLFLDRSVLWRPFWLEEAAAEYFRKVGRNPETKRIVPADRIPAEDIFSIVPSGTYKDTDPAGPFRIQSYRLFRIALEGHTSELRAYIGALKQQTGREAKLSIDEDAATELLNQFLDTRIPPGPPPTDIQAREVPAATVSLRRGDVHAAARQFLQASNWYEGDSEDARGARAILLAQTGGAEALPALARAADELPGNGQVQNSFGSMVTQDPGIVAKQIESLQRAVRLLPLMGRAHAQLARVLILGGRAEQALPELDRALSLEPEYADRFFMLRAEALLALKRFDEASRTAKFAVTLPHGDRYGERSSDAAYNQIARALDQRIQDIQVAAERLQVEQLMETVSVEASRREPVRPPPPPPQPDRAGRIDYQYEATNPVEIVKSVLPDYADALVNSGKAGRVVLQVNIGIDGMVTNATITESQVPEMNTETVTAAKKWTFKPLMRAGKPAAFNLKLTFQFSIQ